MTSFMPLDTLFARSVSKSPTLHGRLHLMGEEAKILGKHQKHFQRIEEELQKGLDSGVQLIQEVGRHSLMGPGKRLRPLFFVLCGELMGKEAESLYPLSIVFEYIHTASLLHDDVLDNAELRRKKPAANVLWGNHAAVLEGDYLYSKAFSVAVSYGNLQLLKCLTETTTRMAEGQVLELLHTWDWEISPETYMEIIVAKTAVLLSAACACGGLAAGAGQREVDSLAHFGLNMGIAFQLTDDLLDYASTREVMGKPVCKDLREGKVTLPLIYTLAELDSRRRRSLLAPFSEIEPDRPKDREEKFQRVVELVRRNGALERVRMDAQKFVEKAASYLGPLPEGPTKLALLELNSFILERSF